MPLIVLISSPPCWLNGDVRGMPGGVPDHLNRLGLRAAQLVVARPGKFDGVELVGCSHVDAVQGGNLLVELGAHLVGGFSQPQTIDAVQTLASGWINDMLDGTHNGIYGWPGQTVQIPTNAGTATAIALSAPPTPVSRFDVLIRAVLNFAISAFVNIGIRAGCVRPLGIGTRIAPRLSGRV